MYKAITYYYILALYIPVLVTLAFFVHNFVLCFVHTALKWDKFMILAHSMGEYIVLHQYSTPFVHDLRAITQGLNSSDMSQGLCIFVAW